MQNDLQNSGNSFKVLHTLSAAGADAGLSSSTCVSWSTWFCPTKPGSGLNVNSNKSRKILNLPLNPHAWHSNQPLLPRLRLLSLLGQLHVCVKLRKSIFPQTCWDTLGFIPIHADPLPDLSAHSHRTLPAHQEPFALKCVVWLNKLIISLNNHFWAVFHAWNMLDKLIRSYCWDEWLLWKSSSLLDNT